MEATTFLLALAAAAGGPGEAAAEAGEAAALRAIEAASHDSWLAGDGAALGALIDEDYLFVAMNGGVERRADVLGREGAPPRRRAVEVRSLSVAPDEVVLNGEVGIVVSTMTIDAAVSGRPLPPRMRVLSVYRARDGGWRLAARSITPILQPPPRFADQ